MNAILILTVLAAVYSVGNSVSSYGYYGNCQNITAQNKIEEANMALVLEYYQKVFGDQDFDAIYEYLGEPYIQHNPWLPDGRDALRAALPEWLKDTPKHKLDIKRAATYGNLVWVHQKMNWMGKPNAVMDIFRVEDGKIYEHWDVIQEVPKTSANNNTMF